MGREESGRESEGREWDGREGEWKLARRRNERSRERFWEIKQKVCEYDFLTVTVCVTVFVSVCC